MFFDCHLPPFSHFHPHHIFNFRLLSFYGSSASSNVFGISEKQHNNFNLLFSPSKEKSVEILRGRRNSAKSHWKCERKTIKHVAKEKISIWFEIKYDFYLRFHFIFLAGLRNRRVLFTETGIDDPSKGKSNYISVIAAKECNKNFNESCVVPEIHLLSP